MVQPIYFVPSQGEEVVWDLDKYKLPHDTQKIAWKEIGLIRMDEARQLALKSIPGKSIIALFDQKTRERVSALLNFSPESIRIQYKDAHPRAGNEIVVEGKSKETLLFDVAAGVQRKQNFGHYRWEEIRGRAEEKGVDLGLFGLAVLCNEARVWCGAPLPEMDKVTSQDLEIVATLMGPLGETKEREAFYLASIQHKPTREAYNNLGIILNDRKRFSEAEAAFREAIKLDPQYALAYSNLGNALADQNGLSEAEAAYRKAIQLDPKYASAYVNLGASLWRQNGLSEAEAAYRKAIELDPAFAKAYSNLGVALMDQNKFSEAEAAYRKAIKLDPAFAKAYFNLGNVLIGQNRLGNAEAAYQKAIELNPKFAVAYFNLGVNLEGQNRLSEAEAVYQKAIQLDPTNIKAHQARGLILKRLGRYREANDHFVIAGGFANYWRSVGTYWASLIPGLEKQNSQTEHRENKPNRLK